MIEFLVFITSLAADQLVKLWAMANFKSMPGVQSEVIKNFLWICYQENTGVNVSFIRGRSAFMMVMRVLQVVLVLYLVIKKRGQLKTITRIALMMFLAGMIGNQLNYILMDYVPDMLYCIIFPGIIFNVADVLIFVAMIILFIRMAFFEGQDFINWFFDRFDRKKYAAVEVAVSDLEPIRLSEDVEEVPAANVETFDDESLRNGWRENVESSVKDDVRNEKLPE